jgi:hypothetical protein
MGSERRPSPDPAATGETRRFQTLPHLFRIVGLDLTDHRVYREAHHLGGGCV